MTATVQDIVNCIEHFAPRRLAESWDNVGLLIGNPAAAVTGILVGLDPTPALLEEAAAGGCNLVITHHPAIFRPLHSVRLDSPEGKFLASAIRQQLNVLSCHTNFDSAASGVSDVLANRLGLTDIRPLAAGGEIEDGCGLGRTGRYDDPLTAGQFLRRLRSACNPPWLLAAGPQPRRIQRVAVCAGSCSGEAERALAAGAQVFVTAEVKHSIARWAEEAGLWIIDAGHFATESIAMHDLAIYLAAETASRFGRITIQSTDRQKPPLLLLDNDKEKEC